MVTGCAHLVSKLGRGQRRDRFSIAQSFTSRSASHSGIGSSPSALYQCTRKPRSEEKAHELPRPPANRDTVAKVALLRYLPLKRSERVNDFNGMASKRTIDALRILHRACKRSNGTADLVLCENAVVGLTGRSSAAR